MRDRTTPHTSSRRVRPLPKRPRPAVRKRPRRATLAQDLVRATQEHRERMMEQLFRVLGEFSEDVGIDRQATRRCFLKAEKSVARSPYRLHQAVEFQTMSRISEILRAWYEEPQFLDEDGEPSVLPLEGAKSFATLAARFLPRFKPEDIAEILIAAQVLRRDARGNLIPLRRTVIFTKPNPMMLDRVPVIMKRFLSTICHNTVTQSDQGARLERLTTFDRLPVELVAEFNEQIKVLAQAFLNRIDTWANARQLPETPKSRKRLARVGVEVFSYMETDTIRKRGPRA